MNSSCSGSSTQSSLKRRRICRPLLDDRDCHLQMNNDGIYVTEEKFPLKNSGLKCVKNHESDKVQIGIESSSGKLSDSVSSLPTCLVIRTNASTVEYEPLPLEYWERSDGCREAKFNHMDKIDRLCSSRERLVLLTTLYEEDTVLETNMFPCECSFSCVIHTLLMPNNFI